MRVFISTLLVTSFFWVSAQRNHEWSSQGIAFTLPNGFHETVNSSVNYEAQSQNMGFGIYLYDEMEETTDASGFIMKIAKSLDLREVEESEGLDVEGFDGAYLFGYEEGDAVLLLGLLDTDTNSNMYVIVTFDEKELLAEEYALDILKSIEKF